MKRTIIFTSVPDFMVPVVCLVKRLGYEVYFLSTIFSNKDSIKILLDRGITPLPMETLPWFNNFSTINSDPEMKVYSHSQKYHNPKMLDAMSKLYPATVGNKEKKLSIIIHNHIAMKNMGAGGVVNLYANTFPEKKFLMIDFTLSGYNMPEMSKNVKQLTIPVKL